MKSKSPANIDELNTSDFDFHVPERLIAQQPLDRDESRLIVRRENGELRHGKFSNLLDSIPSNSLLILNNSKVIASRLFGLLPTGGKVETFLLEPVEQSETQCTWTAIARPLKKLRVGTEVSYDGGVAAKVVQNDALLQLQFNKSKEEILSWLERFGIVPLPPYIRRDNPLRADKSPDRPRYQTVYATSSGSVAAPTAGLHFSKKHLNKLSSSGIDVEYVTLHVGAGTFLPVHSEDPSEHLMHEERYEIPAKTLAAVEKAKGEGRTIIGVGTTTLRCLEAVQKKAVAMDCPVSELADQPHRTDLYLKPKSASDRYRSWCLDALLTNFHQPKSTLFMLICVLIGFNEAKRFYDQAISEEYRLFSYGDSCLLWFK